MTNAELREFCMQMIGKFKLLSDIQKEMQYETIDAKFTEWELKRLIFALNVLREEVRKYVDTADTPQTESQRNSEKVKGTPQTESTGSPIGDYRDGVGAWQTDKLTEEEFDTMIAKGLLGQTDCDDRYAVRTDSGEVVAYACPLGCEQTDCGWK